MKKSKTKQKPKQSTFKTVFTNLTFWVLIAIIIGVLMGQYYPSQAVEMKIVGDTFIDIVKV